MQTKTTVRYRFTRMAIVKRQKISVGEDVEKVESSYIAGGNIKQAATLENSFHCKGYIQKK